MDRYCFFYFAQLFLVASYVTQLYERYSQVPGADMRTKMVKSRSSAAGSSFRNDYVGTVTFVSDKGSSDWHAIVDNNIYCQLRSLTDGLPTDKPVVVGASIWLDAKRENGQSWVCTRIHDLWIPKNLPADSETRENPSAKHPEIKIGHLSLERYSLVRISRVLRNRGWPKFTCKLRGQQALSLRRPASEASAGLHRRSCLTRHRTGGKCPRSVTGAQCWLSPCRLE